jgi:hypothetical protein
VVCKPPPVMLPWVLLLQQVWWGEGPIQASVLLGMSMFVGGLRHTMVCGRSRYEQPWRWKQACGL